MSLIRKWLATLRNRLEGLDYVLLSVRGGRHPDRYDAMRRREGLTPFRKAWWLCTQLESYGTLRRYARLLDRFQVSGFRFQVEGSQKPGVLKPAFNLQSPTCNPKPATQQSTKHSSRVLILRMNHLGDMIHLMPTVREIRRQRPDWRLELITGPWNRELVKIYDLFDEVHYWTPDVVQYHRGNRKDVLAKTKERKWVEALRREGVDMVFCPSSPHFCELPVIVGLRPGTYVGGEWKMPPSLFASVGAAVKSIPDATDMAESRTALEDADVRATLGITPWGGEYITLPFNSRHYEMNAMGNFLPLMGLERPELKLFFPVSESARERVAGGVSGVEGSVSGVGCRVSGEQVHEAQSTKHDARAPLVLLFPGSGWPGKNWPANRFAALADWLINEYRARVCMLGVPEEWALCERVVSAMQGRAENVAGKLSLEESAALMESAALIIGNDSAPIHIAAARNRPTVSLWGPTFPEKWAPRGDRHLVVRADHCDGCIYWHPNARCHGRPACMTTLSVKAVTGAIRGAGVLSGIIDPTLESRIAAP